jgi:phosphoribosylformylglycinamidine (FGAM) synthase-like enzyme
VALAECAFHGDRKLGCEVDLEGTLRADALLFGESQSRMLVTCRKAEAARLLALASRRAVPAKLIGRVGGTDIAVKRAGREIVRVAVAEAFRIWKDSLPAFFKAAA